MNNKKNKFTPGPWFVGDNSVNGRYVACEETHIIVAETYPDEHQDFEANAALIAMAPEMFEALKLTLRLLKSIDNNTARRLEFDFKSSAEVHLIEKILNKAVG